MRRLHPIPHASILWILWGVLWNVDPLSESRHPSDGSQRA